MGQIYAPEDPRRESGFSIFYMGINLGSTIAPLICGWVGEKMNWHWGLGLAGVGMTFGVVTILRGQKRLGEAGLRPVTPPTPEIGAQWQRSFRNAVGAVVLAGAVLAGLHLSGVMELSAERLVNGAGFVLVTITLGLFGWMFWGGDWTPEERKRLVVIAVLFVGSTLFWAAYEQAGSSFNLFAKNNTDRMLLGLQLPASWFQSLIASFIICFAAVFAWMWISHFLAMQLGSRRRWTAWTQWHPTAEDYASSFNAIPAAGVWARERGGPCPQAWLWFIGTARRGYETPHDLSLKPTFVLSAGGDVWTRSGGHHQLQHLHRPGRSITELVQRTAGDVLP